jgi:hypothetical protein
MSRAEVQETTPIVRTIEEHPVVMGLRAEIERMKRENAARGEDYLKAVRERDQKHAAEKVSLQAQILDLQNTVAGHQEKLLTIRAAVL